MQLNFFFLFSITVEAARFMSLSGVCDTCVWLTYSQEFTGGWG